MVSSIEDSIDNTVLDSAPWCGCYPSCNEVSYSYVSTHNFYRKNATAYGSFPRGEAFAQIQIFYYEPYFLGVHRQTGTSIVDFLGTCGGLLGLFLGFSFISGVEVVYHLTLRPLFHFAVNKRQKIKPTIVIAKRPPLRGNPKYFRNYYSKSNQMF